MKSGLQSVATIGILLVVVLWLSLPAVAFAAPPYITDDPEPVDYQHWEIYLGSLFTKQSDAWTATTPHLELNYGPLPDVQLQMIVPMVLYAPNEGGTSYGYGDTQLGIKFRFVHESEWRPQVATYPQLVVPTGSHARNLGNGHFQTFLPIWLQKSMGKWTAYGGGGYWINPGPGNHNWWFTGFVVQREVLPHLTPGIEFFHGTSQVVGGPHETGINLGLIWDFTDTQHIVLSAGPAIEGPNQLQGYLAYELTFATNP
ncbi:MAG TPA: transporter [Candidatus Binataceae bacterium]|nr:transporter [Candidatus Binataceae bacterium]